MTTPIKTQCPHCHACFNLQKTQLNQADATVRCDHCQQDFLVNRHLIVTTNTVTTDTDTDTDDTLIHDDMDIEESPETNLEYDSLDGMDAWLAQSTPTNDSFSASNAPQKNSPKTPDEDVDLTAKPLLTPTAQSTKTSHNMTEKAAISSAAANDIHASVDNTPDNTWLEQLLKEKEDNESNTQADTDLAQLLINMGVPTNDEDKVNQERKRNIQARMQPRQMQTRTSIAALLWTMGCVVLVMLLFAQYVIFNLDTLIKNPAYAERLQTVCAIAACSLPNADLTALSVTNLNHRSSRISTASAFSDVQATLSNQSSQVQLLPSLKISVYSPNALIGEFLAMPDDYLLSPQNQLAAEGRKQLMFTIPVADNQIDHVTIAPVY